MRNLRLMEKTYAHQRKNQGMIRFHLRQFLIVLWKTQFLLMRWRKPAENGPKGPNEATIVELSGFREAPDMPSTQSDEDNIRYQQFESLSNYIRNLHSDVVVWGDFNDILSSEEKRGGLQHAMWSFSRFQSLLDECDLVDLGFRGYPFTWRNNRRGSDFIESRLDRVLASSPWNLHYHQAVVEHLECVGSDHKALLLRTSSVIKKRVTPFRFDARWFEYEEVRQIVQTQWAQGVEIDHAKGEISKLESEGREFHLEEIGELEDSLAKAWEKEETYWMQKSRHRWLQCGNHNTSYFHASTVERHRRNHISGIENMQGVWISDQKGVMDEFQHFFTNVYLCEDNRQVHPVVNLIPTRVTTSMNNSLIRPISSSEVKTALFDMPPSKAPGYDGMIAGFFQRYWDIVGVDVCRAVQSFFHSGKMLGSVNRTQIVLIPKILRPTKERLFVRVEVFARGVPFLLIYFCYAEKDLQRSLMML
ncbi:hypothetical protein Vadar_002245 [Vaccinium darrowii]|uniref:Uncharacterized protein n=1 Tax=Vaccinium darrowii TaxID=229202 RepID=A0ACB7WXF5_9ERIC|nr:hypothetical protein Vadar_002245 [Vaccinium darrowii]